MARTGLTGSVPKVGDRNIHGEAVTRIDFFAHNAVVEEVSAAGTVSGIVSEEAGEFLPLPTRDPDGGCILAVDPLDGSSNLGVNVPVGTIFSIFPNPASPTGVLQPGRRQLAAGYILYGAATVLVFTSGSGVHGFLYESSSPGARPGDFRLVRRNLRIPSPPKRRYSINEAYTERWLPRQHDLVRYFRMSAEERAAARRRLKQGEPEIPKRRSEDAPSAPKQAKRKGFSARYIGSLVADFHRTLLTGGLFMYPALVDAPEGKLRLMYEAAPVAMLAEHAGGKATNGAEDILDLVPRDIHHCTPLFTGSRELVDLASAFLA